MVAPDYSGRRVGGFELIEPLASGGFATVYRARQVRLGRDVAVKVLDPSLARDPDIAARFEREGRAAASLDHPNVVAVYEAGEEDGLVFLAMRLVDGHTLDQLLLDGGPLTVARTAKYIKPVADALDHAHERGLIHRDVKPSNIFIDGSRVWLGDFGIAATADQVGRYTTGTLGTAHYMAPEQASAGELDGRSDLYALGCVVHRCLTGRPPYDKGELVATLVAHVNDPVPVLGHAALDRFLAMALAKNPAERFACGADLVAALRSVGPVDVASLGGPPPVRSAARDAATGSAVRSPAPPTSVEPSAGPSVDDGPPVAAVPPEASSPAAAPAKNPDEARPPPPPAGSTAAPPPAPPPSTIAPVHVGTADDVTVPPIPVTDAAVTESGSGPEPAPASDSRGGRISVWLWAPATVVVAVALAVGAWYLLVRDDGASGGGQVGDGRGVAQVDVGDAIVVGDTPLVVAISETSVLVANVGDETLASVSRADQRVGQPADLRARPSDVHVGGDRAWVTSRDPARSVMRFSLVAGEDGQGSFEALPLGFAAARVAADEDGAWVSDPDAGRIVRLDRDGSEVAEVAVGDDPVDLVLAAGSLWVSDTGAGTVVRVDPDDRSVIETIDLEGGAGAITGDDDAVYVVDRDAATMTRIATDDTSSQLTVPVADRPTRPETGAGGVWLISPDGGSVHRYDPDSLEEIQVVEVGGTLGGLAVDGDDLWVTRTDTDALIRVGLTF